MTEPYYQDERCTLYCGDCREILATLEPASVSLIATDPPYHRVKMTEEWDRQWKTDADYLAWLGTVLDEFQRVLKPNGSLYLFASPQMDWGVEGEIRKRFNVLTNIRWRKPPFSTKAEMFTKEQLRAPFPASETIIFAEQYGADSMALGESGYAAQCEQLRGFVFEPLRAYLAGEFERAGMFTPEGKIAANVACGFSASAGGMASRHYFGTSQWQLPTEPHYEAMRQLLNTNGTDYLRREYEDLRRPFSMTADDAYTDVWDFPTVGDYPGKHPCEKPADMIRQIVKASSREGDTVLDCFCGSGVTGQVCAELGREAILIDSDPHWVRQASRRVQMRPPERRRKEKPMPLFD